MPYDRHLLDFDEETDLKNYKVWIFVIGQPPLSVPFFVSLHGIYGTYELQYGLTPGSNKGPRGTRCRKSMPPINKEGETRNGLAITPTFPCTPPDNRLRVRRSASM